MSFERVGIFFDWSCDFCSFEDQTEGDDFRDAWDVAKRNGWRSFKEGTEWRHKCPSCVAGPIDEAPAF